MHIKIRGTNYHIIDLTVRSTVALLLVYCLLPWRFAAHYSYIEKEHMLTAFVKQVVKNITRAQQELPACDYEETIKRNAFAYNTLNREHLQHAENIFTGGEYYPTECRTLFSTAIIVPYRQREQQLHKFLIYMHNFLRQQNIHYRIFLVEQFDQKPFNRAKLFNIGSIIAAEYGFPCLILHDVDLLPLNFGQVYACTQLPRHLCAALDIFRYNLPYHGLFGGVTAIQLHQFNEINGMSNLYDGWGGEDDDLFQRLNALNFDICRFAPAYSEYTMMQHKRENPNKQRLPLLRSARSRIKSDGLNTLHYKEKERRMHALFTHILAET